jgi:hypothetical protein
MELHFSPYLERFKAAASYWKIYFCTVKATNGVITYRLKTTAMQPVLLCKRANKPSDLLDRDSIIGHI